MRFPQALYMSRTLGDYPGHERGADIAENQAGASTKENQESGPGHVCLPGVASDALAACLYRLLRGADAKEDRGRLSAGRGWEMG